MPGASGGSELARRSPSSHAQSTSDCRSSSALPSTIGNQRASASPGTAASSAARCASTMTPVGSAAGSPDSPESCAAGFSGAAQPSAPGVTATKTRTAVPATSASRFSSAPLNDWSAAITNSTAPARPTASSRTPTPEHPSDPLSGVSTRAKCLSSGLGRLSSTRRGGRASAGPTVGRSARYE